MDKKKLSLQEIFRILLLSLSYRWEYTALDPSGDG